MNNIYLKITCAVGIVGILIFAFNLNALKKIPFVFILNCISMIMISLITLNVYFFQRYFNVGYCMIGFQLVLSGFFLKNFYYLVIKNFHILNDYQLTYFLIYMVVLLIITIFCLNFLLQKMNICPDTKDCNENENFYVWNQKIKVKWEPLIIINIAKHIVLGELVIMLIYAPISINKQLSRGSNQFFLNPYVYHATNALILAWNYYCLNRWRWIKFERFFRVIDREYRFTVYMSMYPALKANHQNEKCAICLEDNPTSHFCENHCFHDECIIKHLKSRTELVQQQIIGNHLRFFMMQQFPIYMLINQHRVTDLKREDMPSCPTCRSQLKQDSIEIYYKLINRNDKSEIKVDIK